MVVSGGGVAALFWIFGMRVLSGLDKNLEYQCENAYY